MSRKLVFILLLTLFQLSQLNSTGQEKGEEKSSLNLAIGFRLGLLMNPEMEKSFEMTKKKIIKYGIDEVRIYGGGNAITYKYLDIEGFPEIEKKGSAKELKKFKDGLKWFEDHGIRITLSGGEPSLPGVSYRDNGEKTFFDFYPEAKYLDNGLLWKFYEERTFALFNEFPEVDATDCFLWETPILDDLNYFPGIKWQESISWHKGNNQYYSQADYLTEFMSAMTRGARKAGKDYSILTFSHYPHQERILLESLKEIEKREIPLLMVHKSQPGDWDPYKGPNNIMMQTQSNASLLFDGIGEYWGRSIIPYCFPEEIQYRVLHALKENRNIHTLAMRTFWENDQTLFNNYNEINLYALARFSKNPNENVDQIWKDWANQKFGEKAASKVIEALKRTDDIGKLVYYFKGIWVHEHSKMGSLDYMLAQVLHTGRAMLEWHPDNILNNMLIEAFMFHPNEDIIKIAVDERKKALALCNQSIHDIESVKNILASDEYKKLSNDLYILKRFVELSIFHIEAYLRYIINRDNPNTENSIKLKNCTLKLENIAVIIDKEFGKSNYLLSADRIRRFIKDINRYNFKNPNLENNPGYN